MNFIEGGTEVPPFFSFGSIPTFLLLQVSERSSSIWWYTLVPSSRLPAPVVSHPCRPAPKLDTLHFRILADHMDLVDTRPRNASYSFSFNILLYLYFPNEIHKLPSVLPHRGFTDIN